MSRRLAMAVAALLTMATFASGSAVAQITCAVDDHQMAMVSQDHRNRPGSAKSHDCTDACPLMCGAVMAQQSEAAAPMLALLPRVAVKESALSGLDNRPDIPPPRMDRDPLYSIQSRKFR